MAISMKYRPVLPQLKARELEREVCMEMGEVVLQVCEKLQSVDFSAKALPYWNFLTRRRLISLMN